jgi:hypothetical protein
MGRNAVPTWLATYGTATMHGGMPTASAWHGGRPSDHACSGIFMHQQGHVLTSDDNAAAWSGVVSGCPLAAHEANKKKPAQNVLAGF